MDGRGLAGPTLLVALAVAMVTGWPASALPAPAPATFAHATSSHEVLVAGTARRFLLHVPANVDGPAPLVLAFHGAGGTGASMARDSGLSPLADRDGFVAAYPDGQYETWNAGDCCLRSVREDVPDVAFVAAIIHRLVEDGLVDRRRVYAMGFSNGAMLAARLACELDIRGIAVVAGAFVSPCRRTTTTDVFLVHGTADRMVPIAGYTGDFGPGLPVRFPPFTEALDRWGRLLGCRGWRSGATAGIRTTDATGCPGGHRVEGVVIAAMGHAWPGNRALATPDDRGYDATEAALRQFEL